MSKKNKKTLPTQPRELTGLVLTGGGARSAFQIGAIRAIIDITSELGIEQPFPILTGTSAGALNATYLAANANNMKAAARRLQMIWSSMHTERVYKVDPYSVGKGALRWLLELSTGGLIKRKKKASALLDTAPIKELIQKEFSPDAIKDRLADKSIHSIAIKSLDYTTGKSITFFQSRETITPWKRARRYSESAIITPDHILASASIPILFPPVKINGHYFGDGSLRNQTPLSPAVKLGARKLVVIGVRMPDEAKEPVLLKPSPARILGLLLNSVLLDAIDLDFERMNRINSTLTKLKSDAESNLSPVEACMIRPSQDIGQIASEEAARMPRTIRYLLKGLGSRAESADLISYLLFEPAFIKRVIKLGYEDAMKMKEEIIALYKS